MSGRRPSGVPSHSWPARNVCRQELPWLLVAVIAHHETWLLVAALAAIALSRTARWANRALARSQLRRMRNA